MVNADFWLDSVKGRLRVRSDYALAKRWRIEPSRISQYRRGRLRIPLAVVLDMAAVMRCDALEIIASLEWHKAKERDKAAINTAYFNAATKTVGERMSAIKSESYSPRR